MTQNVDLQTITDAYGNWMASQLGTGLAFTESTNFLNNSNLNGGNPPWVNLQTTVTSDGLTYDPNQTAVPTPGLTLESFVNNRGTEPVVSTYTNSQTTTQAFTWTNTTTLSLGVTVGVTVGVPNVAQATCSDTVTVTDALAVGATYTNTQTWSTTQQITTPANSALKIDFTIASCTYNVNYTGTCTLGNYVCVWFTNPVTFPGGTGKHYCWFIPISEVLSAVRTNSLADMSAFPNDWTVTFAGVFTGQQGTQMTLSTTPEPLPPQPSQMTADVKPGTITTPVIQPHFKPAANTVTLKTGGPTEPVGPPHPQPTAPRASSKPALTGPTRIPGPR